MVQEEDVLKFQEEDEQKGVHREEKKGKHPEEKGDVDGGVGDVNRRGENGGKTFHKGTTSQHKTSRASSRECYTSPFCVQTLISTPSSCVMRARGRGFQATQRATDHRTPAS